MHKSFTFIMIAAMAITLLVSCSAADEVKHPQTFEGSPESGMSITIDNANNVPDSAKEISWSPIPFKEGSEIYLTKSFNGWNWHWKGSGMDQTVANGSEGNSEFGGYFFLLEEVDGQIVLTITPIPN